MTDRAFFLDIAHRMGRRIAAQAMWSGTQCTWDVVQPDPDGREEKLAMRAPASGGIYNGTAGIGLFLLQLWRQTQKREIRRTAEGAMAHTIAAAANLTDSSFGFYSGRVGIAYAAAMAGGLLQREDYLDNAWEILAPLQANERRDAGLDVIAGAAGAIPALLQLAEMLDRPEPFHMAVRLGEHLIDVARRETTGWSWGQAGRGRIQHARNLTGYAHGASGMAHALFELYAVTGARHFQYVADHACLYERQFFDPDESNWPDFRHTEIGHHVYDGHLEELKAEARAGRLLPYENKYMMAWCHGAPGIGLSRLRAYEITGIDLYREEAEAAVTCVQHWLERKSGGHSLCHGGSGNSELLLEADRVSGHTHLTGAAARYAEDAAHRYELAGVPWPSGALRALPDPSLMLGDAGIGYFFLRLHDASVPSLLLLRGPAKGHFDAERPIEERVDVLQRDYASRYFGNSISRMEQIDPAFQPTASYSPPLLRSEIAVTYEKLKGMADIRSNDSNKDAAAMAFFRESLQYDAECRLTDYSVLAIHDLARIDPKELDWEHDTWALAPHVRVASNDSRQPHKAPMGDGASPSCDQSLYYLVRPVDGVIRVEEIGHATALLLQTLDQAGTIDDITTRFANAYDIDGNISDDGLREWIRDQLRAAFAAGLIAPLRSPVPTA